MNLARQLRARRDTYRSLRLHRLIRLLARASRESPSPFARRCEPLRSQTRAAKIADRSAALRDHPLAYARWSGNVSRQLSRFVIVSRFQRINGSVMLSAGKHRDLSWLVDRSEF